MVRPRTQRVVLSWATARPCPDPATADAPFRCITSVGHSSHLQALVLLVGVYLIAAPTVVSNGKTETTISTRIG